VFSRRLHPFGSSLTRTTQHICVPSRQTGRVSSIGDGKRRDLLAPLLLTSGVLDIDKCKQLHSNFLDNIDAAGGEREKVEACAENAWLSTVSITSVYAASIKSALSSTRALTPAPLCAHVTKQCGQSTVPYNVSRRGIQESVAGVDEGCNLLSLSACRYKVSATPLNTLLARYMYSCAVKLQQLQACTALV
jgi:hypothetical protein